jgi:hypothetical protein
MAKTYLPNSHLLSVTGFVPVSAAQRQGESGTVVGDLLLLIWKGNHHLDRRNHRSALDRDLLFYGSFLEMFFDRGIMGLSAHPR